MGLGLGLGLAARAEDEGELVGVDIQVGHRLVGVGVGNRGVQQLSLAAHADPLSGGHRQRARQQAGHAGEKHGVSLHAGSRHAEDEGEVGHEPVVGSEDCGAERARQGLARLGGQGADHLGVDVLVGLHVSGHVIVNVAGGTLLRPLGHRQDEDRAEKMG